jgi:integrase
VPLSTSALANRRLHPNSLNPLLRGLAREAGLPEEVVEQLSPHGVRHGFARDVRVAGVPEPDLSRHLDHSNLEQTSAYGGRQVWPEQHPVIAALDAYTGKAGAT